MSRIRMPRIDKIASLGSRISEILLQTRTPCQESVASTEANAVIAQKAREVRLLPNKRRIEMAEQIQEEGLSDRRSRPTAKSLVRPALRFRAPRSLTKT